MMPTLVKGRYRARLAETPDDLRRSQRLRWLCFRARNEENPGDGALDRDALDQDCRHLLVEDTLTGQLLCSFRFLPLSDGAQIARSYSAQFYDLSALHRFDSPLVELGRFCIRPGQRDPDILRIAWAALTRHVEEAGVAMLFGCTSFPGGDPALHAEAFALLGDRHLAPRHWRPGIKAPQVVRFDHAPQPRLPDPRRAMAAMPPLLRSYLAMGGWVSDHAVVDPVLKTMHVFTGVEVRAIPPARKRLLHALLDRPA